MPNGKKKKKKDYYKDFNLANFIADEKCVICGNPKVLDNIPEDEPPSHYDPPPEYPVVTSVKEYFFVVCANCRQRIADGLCVTCGKKLKNKDTELDYFFLHVGQALAEEIIRVRSELTKWIPQIQRYKKKTAPVVANKDKKDVKSLFKKKKAQK